MQHLLLFYIFLFILEIICIVGIVYAYIWLHNAHKTVLAARIMVMTLKKMATRKLQFSKETLYQATKGFNYVSRFIPWWAKLLFKGLRWLGKINARTS